jgi:hypothetical protein
VGLEAGAIVPGAAVGIVTIAVAVLAGRLSGAVDDGQRAYLLLPLIELGLAGLFTGGWLAALRCRRAPLVHGAVAGLVAVGVCTAAAALGRLAGGDDVAWATVAVWLLLAVGALASLRPRHRTDSPA